MGQFSRRPRATQPHPQFHEFQAIWDTGATNSVITQRVVDALHLQPIGMTRVQSFDSIKMSETYLVTVSILNHQVGVPNVKATKGSIADGVDVLIGMDIITIGDFAITNRGGSTVFSFCAPSQRCLDFVQEHKAAERKKGPGFRGFKPPLPHPADCRSVQRRGIALAGGHPSGATVRCMADPRLQLTAQELIYAASALRAEARRAERQAADPQYQSSRAIFEGASKAYDELAGKLTRIAEGVRQ